MAFTTAFTPETQDADRAASRASGDPARRIGNEFVFSMLARQNIETLWYTSATTTEVPVKGIGGCRLRPICRPGPPYCSGTLRHDVLYAQAIDPSGVKPRRCRLSRAGSR